MAGILDFLTSQIGMNAVGAGLNAAGQFIGAGSRFQFGNEQRQAMDFQVQQFNMLANDQLASAQRSAYSAGLQTKYLASNALAAAAASGGGASDPTVVRIMSRIASEGAYRQQTATFQGQEQARYLELQAAGKEYEGEITSGMSRQAGVLQGLSGVASLVRGNARGQSLYQRFGNGGPSNMNDFGED